VSPWEAPLRAVWITSMLPWAREDRVAPFTLHTTGTPTAHRQHTFSTGT